MVSSVRFTAVALVVIAFAFIHVDSKQCFFCDSKDSCKDNKTLTLGDCGLECVKIDNSKGEAMNRTCLSQDQCDLYRYCYLCKEDKCNGSSGVSPSFIIMGIVGAIVAKYYM